MSLTLGRLRQARDVAVERLNEKERRDLRVREQELRELASHIAASLGHERGIKAARSITLLAAPPGKKALRYVTPDFVSRLGPPLIEDEEPADV